MLSQIHVRHPDFVILTIQFSVVFFLYTQYDNVSWYLDNLEVPWSAVYANEPCVNVPDALCPLVLGGHGEMWGETVDASDLEPTVWPKLASIAEKLWCVHYIEYRCVIILCCIVCVSSCVSSC